MNRTMFIFKCIDITILPISVSEAVLLMYLQLLYLHTPRM